MKEVLKELDKPGRIPWLSENTILLVESGSYAYGTNTEKSDRDYKGVAIPPLEYHLGLNKFEHFVSNTDDTKKNTAEDIDITVYSLNKIIRLGLNSNPHVLEMLFADDDSIIIASDAGHELIAHRYLFLSNRIKRTYGGFAIQNRRKIERAANKKGTVIGSKEYDRKAFMHTVRIYETAIEMFTSGTMSTKRPNAETLLSLRSGNMTYGEAMSLLDNLEKKFQLASINSSLPNKPNQKEIEKLLIKLTMEHLNINQ